MSTRVRISTTGARAATGKPAPDGEAVARMIAHWEGRFAQILPDEPDLIVVPECCDRYPQHPLAERLAYYRERGSKRQWLLRRLSSCARGGRRKLAQLGAVVRS